MARTARSASSPLASTWILLPWVAASVKTPMMLRPSVVCPSLEKMTCAPNLFTVCTSKAAARAWSPSLFLISNFLITLLIQLFVDIAVFGMDGKFILAQTFVQLFHQHNRTMSSPGTTQGECQTAFSLALVQGQGKFQKRKKPIEKYPGLIVFENIILDLGLQTALSSEFLDKMRIREKSNIKNDIGIVRNAKLISEGGQEYTHPTRA